MTICDFCGESLQKANKVNNEVVEVCSIKFEICEICAKVLLADLQAKWKEMCRVFSGINISEGGR